MNEKQNSIRQYALPLAFRKVSNKNNFILNDSNKFAYKFLNEYNVCVCPGYAFGPKSKKYIRINLGGNEKDLYKGCRKLLNFTNEL